MKINPPQYYRKIKIADNTNDIHIDEKSRINDKSKDCYEVHQSEFGQARKIIRHSHKPGKNVIYEYSNKGNLISFTYTNHRKFRIKETYDYTKHEKMLHKKKYYKDGKYLKCEEYKDNKIDIITYFLEEDKYCCEFFKDSRHPYKVEYYNKQGFKI